MLRAIQIPSVLFFLLTITTTISRRTTKAMPESHLPPLGSDYVFSVSSSALIDAPRDKVWSIMMDFPSYTNWWVHVEEAL